MTEPADMGLDGLDGRLYALWATGFTRRWHMNPAMSRFDDYICGHQGRRAQLVISLFPDHSIELLRAAVTHDAGKSRVGDLSRPFKDCGGDLMALHAALGAKVLKAMGFAQDLSTMNTARLFLVDLLDAFLFVQLHHPAEADRNGWPEARQSILCAAHLCDCEAAVSDILNASQSGDFT